MSLSAQGEPPGPPSPYRAETTAKFRPRKYITRAGNGLATNHLWKNGAAPAQDLCINRIGPSSSLPAQGRRKRALSRQHGPKRAAREYMHMEVRHLLMAIGPGVGEQAVTALHQPGLPRDASHRADEARDLGVSSLG